MNFKFENLTPRGMGYHTPTSQSPQRVNRESIKNPPKPDSPGYQSPRGMMPQRVTLFDTKV